MISALKSVTYKTIILQPGCQNPPLCASLFPRLPSSFLSPHTFIGCLSPLSNITSIFSSVCYIEIIQLLTLTHIHNITSSYLLYTTSCGAEVASLCEK